MMIINKNIIHKFTATEQEQQLATAYKTKMKSNY